MPLDPNEITVVPDDLVRDPIAWFAAHHVRCRRVCQLIDDLAGSSGFEEAAIPAPLDDVGQALLDHADVAEHLVGGALGEEEAQRRARRQVVAREVLELEAQVGAKLVDRVVERAQRLVEPGQVGVGLVLGVGDEQRLLVGHVVVHRGAGHAGRLGDVGQGERVVAPLVEQRPQRGEDLRGRVLAMGGEGVLWNAGRPTPEEKAAGLKLPAPGKHAARSIWHDTHTYPGEEHVIRLAAEWSLDPTTIDRRDAVASLGYVGRAPAVWRLKRISGLKRALRIG